MSDHEHPAALLGRMCADSHMDLHTAQQVFDRLYMASAITLAGGSRRKAAALAGVHRNHTYVMLPLKRGEVDDIEW